MQEDRNNHHLKALNDFLKGQLQGWFGAGFLDLERITWSSPAAVLEKVWRGCLRLYIKSR
jgi:hypothetical protein